MTGIYCRKSVDKVDSTSIDTQIEYCKRQTAPNEKVRVYTDRGYSGSNTNRPDFQKLMSDIENGYISRVIVYRIDRISRSVLDFASIYKKFEESNVEFVSATEQFDTSTPMGKAMLQIIMVFAELERKTIQARITDNFYERAKKGLFLAGRAPIGYKKIPHEISGIKTHILEEDVETSGIVKTIFKKYLDGASMSEISRYCNSSDFEFQHSEKFSSTRIMRILSNPVYVRADANVYRYLLSKGAVLHDDISQFNGVYGCTIYGQRKGKTQSKFKNLSGENIQLNLHEGFINSEDWLTVQKRMETNKAIKNNGKGTYTWLTGVIKCGYCGRALTVISKQPNGKRYICCCGRKDGICDDKIENATFDDIEAKAEELLLPYIRNFEYCYTEEPQVDESRLNELRIEDFKLENEIKEIVSAYVGANKTMQSYLNNKIEELEKRRQAISNEIAELNREKPMPVDVNEIRLLADNWSDLDLETKKSIARLFIKRVTYSNEEMHIEWI